MSDPVDVVIDGVDGFLPGLRARGTNRSEVQFLMDAGRTSSDIDITVATYLQFVDPVDLPAFRDAGVDQIVLTGLAGKVYTLSPWPIDQYWELTGQVDPADYALD